MVTSKTSRGLPTIITIDQPAIDAALTQCKPGLEIYNQICRTSVPGQVSGNAPFRKRFDGFYNGTIGFDQSLNGLLKSFRRAA